MDLTKLLKTELLEKCKELKIIGCSSKNKSELIKLINSKKEPINNEMKEKVIDNTDNSTNEIVINKNVSYFNIDILEFTTSKKFDLIYLDPPYETNRTFTVNSIDDETGFDDVWEDNKYHEWLDKLIKHLKSMLSQNGTLVFHISSEYSFIAETVLRKHFKKIQKNYWKRCHGKNTVKNKLGEVIDVLFSCCNNNNIFNLLHIPIDENSVWAFKNKDDKG
jgi:adenine-specific DNA-methyltransferase